MEKTNFWSEAARYGAFVGSLLAVSFLLENALLLSGSMKLFSVMALEYLLAAGLHYYLLHCYTRNRSRLYSAEEGFSFGQGYGFLLVMSGFAGIILGAVQAVYMHLLVGYSTYIDRYVTALSDILSQGGAPSASVESLFSQVFSQLESAPVPSVISTALGGVWSSLLFGAVFGSIIAGVLSRAPRPFEEQHGDE